MVTLRSMRVYTPMRTPIRPRALFSAAPPSSKPYMALGSSRRRRNVTLRTRRKTRRARSLRTQIQDITQEKKRFDALFGQAGVTLHQQEQRLVGSSIAIGGTSNARIGDTIYLKGIGIKGTVNNVSNASTATTAVPIVFKIWIVRTTRNSNPESYWFQIDNGDSNIGYNTGATLDPAGDVSRSRLRLNAQEIKVLKFKQYTVYPTRSLQQNFATYKSVNMYYEFKEPIVLKYSTAIGAPTPFPADAITPNVWICWAATQPNLAPGITAPSVVANLKCTEYYRE